MNLYLKLQRVVAAWAASERADEPERLARAEAYYPHCIKPCEGCEKVPVAQGGLCPGCLDIVAAGLGILGRGKR